MIPPVNGAGITPTAFRATDDIPSLTVGTSYSQWPAARLLSARAYDAVRHGGPTTFTTLGQPPGPEAVHAIFVADPGLVATLPLSLPARPKRNSDRRRSEARGDRSFVAAALTPTAAF